VSAPRWLVLPVAAVLLVAAVIWVQLANGGGRYEPLQTADPCVERVVVSQATGIDALTERLVLLGIDGAACRLGVSREALTLDLAQPGERTDAEVEALRAAQSADRAEIDDILATLDPVLKEA